MSLEGSGPPAARGRRDARRPLRWIKFGLYLAIGAATAALAAPPLRELARLLRGPFSDAPPPIPSPVFWLAVVSVVFVCVAWLVLDAALDRRVPLALLGLELCAFAAALLAPSFAVAPPEGLAAEAGSVQVAFLIARLRERCAAELESSPVLSPDAASLEAELRGALPLTSFRDRFLSRLPPRVSVLSGRDGPVLRPLQGDPPGTIYLAIGGAGSFGWVSGVSLVGEPPVPGILRSDDRPVIGGVTRPDPRPDGVGGVREKPEDEPQSP